MSGIAQGRREPAELSQLDPGRFGFRLVTRCQSGVCDQGGTMRFTGSLSAVWRQPPAAADPIHRGAAGGGSVA